LLWWPTLLQVGLPAQAAVVQLRRYDQRTLTIWATDSCNFTSGEKFLEVTDGWPVFVERAEKLAEDLGEPQALHKLTQDLATHTGAADLLSACGLGNDSPERGLFAYLTAVSGHGYTLDCEEPVLFHSCLTEKTSVCAEGVRQSGFV
jgi:hypothetical protein